MLCAELTSSTSGRSFAPPSRSRARAVAGWRGLCVPRPGVGERESGGEAAGSSGTRRERARRRRSSASSKSPSSSRRSPRNARAKGICGARAPPARRRLDAPRLCGPRDGERRGGVGEKGRVEERLLAAHERRRGDEIVSCGQAPSSSASSLLRRPRVVRCIELEERPHHDEPPLVRCRLRVGRHEWEDDVGLVREERTADRVELRRAVGASHGLAPHEGRRRRRRHRGRGCARDPPRRGRSSLGHEQLEEASPVGPGRRARTRPWR